MRKPLVVSLKSDDIESFAALCQDSECGASEAVEMFLHDLFNGQIVLVKDSEGLSLYYQPQIETEDRAQQLERVTEENEQLRSRVESVQTSLDNTQETLKQTETRKTYLSAQVAEYENQIAILAKQVAEDIKQKNSDLQLQVETITRLSEEKDKLVQVNEQLQKRLISLEAEREEEKTLLVNSQAALPQLQTVEVIPTQTLECLQAMSRAMLDQIASSEPASSSTVTNIDKDTTEIEVGGEQSEHNQPTIGSEISLQQPVEPSVAESVLPEARELPTYAEVTTTECYADLPPWLQTETETEPISISGEYTCAEDEIRAEVECTPTLDREVLEQRAVLMRAIYAKWETPEYRSNLEARIKECGDPLQAYKQTQKGDKANNPPQREELLERALTLAKEASDQGLPKIPLNQRYKTIKEVFGTRARPSTPEDEQMLLRAWGEAELSKDEVEAANQLEYTKKQTWYITKELEVETTREDMTHWLSQAPENSLVRTSTAVLEEMNQKESGKNKVLLGLKERSQQLLLAMFYDNVKPTEDDLNHILEYLAPTIRNLVLSVGI